jgi:hypothetical protein
MPHNRGNSGNKDKQKQTSEVSPSILSFGTSSMGNSFNYNNCSL